MRVWREHFILSLGLALLLGCGKSANQDAPEVPPTKILGSGIIFTYKDGAVKCDAYSATAAITTVANDVDADSDVEVECYAAMPAHVVFGKMAFLLADDTDWVRATEYSPDIVDHTWQKLKLTTGTSSFLFAVSSVAADGLSANYSIPASYVEDYDEFEVEASLKLVLTNQATKNVTYNKKYTKPLPPKPTPSTSPSPSPSDSPSPSPTPSTSPTPSSTPTPSTSPTPSSTPTPSPTPSTSPSPSSTPTPSPTPSTSPTPSSTLTPSPTPSTSPTPSPTPLSSPTPTTTATPVPTTTILNPFE